MTEIINAIIVDDEESGRETLAWLLSENTPFVHVLEKCCSAEEAAIAVKKHSPDLIFLDVQMPGGTGIDFLKKMQDFDFNVIFVTAYDKFALEAIHLSALDYLLKPVKVEELKAAVAKAMELHEEKNQKSRLDFLLNNALAQNGHVQSKMMLPSLTGYDVVNIADIVRLESEINYTRFFFSTGKSTLISKTLKEFEPTLSRSGFYRIHRSHLVNMRHVVRFNKSGGGTVVLTDGTELEIARDRKDDFLAALATY
jgi:two-component system, LytTR family, response regulator